MNTHITVTAKTESEADSFATSLGISAEREAELDDLMDKAHGGSDTYPAAVAMISQSCVNANELAYACFHLGAFAESQRHKQDLFHKLSH